MSRKPDDDVGSPGAPAAGGGHQTPEQARLTGQSAGGRSDAERNESWGEAGAAPGRAPVAMGGSSGGHGDQKAADDEPGERHGSGTTRSEQTGGKVDW